MTAKRLTSYRKGVHAVFAHIAQGHHRIVLQFFLYQLNSKQLYRVKQQSWD